VKEELFGLEEEEANIELSLTSREGNQHPLTP
jgi:hypothetical protein